MLTRISTESVGQSVMAAPPLAIGPDGDLAIDANAAIIRYLRHAGVRTLLYGANALAAHWSLSNFRSWIDRLAELAGPDIWFIPSVGSDAGKLKDQAAVLRQRSFPVALLLPICAPLSHAGLVEIMRDFFARCGVQLLIYIQSDNYVTPQALSVLVDEGVVFGVKYAVPKPSGDHDPYLREIVNSIGADRVISGFGEPAAFQHLLNCKLAGFTSGAVCIAPSLSNALFCALKSGDRARAETLLDAFLPLERLRNEINDIWVLHDAVQLCGLALTGKILSPGKSVSQNRRHEVWAAAYKLLEAERAFRQSQGALFV